MSIAFDLVRYGCVLLFCCHTTTVSAQSDEDLKRRAVLALGLVQSMKTGPGQLASKTSIQRDLKLTTTQIQQIQGVPERAKDAAKQRQSQENRKSGLRLARDLKEETDRLVKEILTAEQLKRLKQIALQLDIRNQGLTMIFTLEKLEDKLSFDPEQRAKTAQERKEFDRALVKAMREHGESQLRQRMDVYHQQSNARILALMTDQQRSAYDDLIGKPFDFANAPDLPIRR